MHLTFECPSFPKSRVFNRGKHLEAQKTPVTILILLRKVLDIEHRLQQAMKKYRYSFSHAFPSNPDVPFRAATWLLRLKELKWHISSGPPTPFAVGCSRSLLFWPPWRRGWQAGERGVRDHKQNKEKKKENCHTGVAEHVLCCSRLLTDP